MNYGSLVGEEAMVELCLMASHGCPPGLGVALQQEQASSRATEGFHPFSSCHVSKQELITSSRSLNSSFLQKTELRSAGGLLDGNLYVRIDSTTKRPAFIEFQETHRDSVHFSMGIAERCTRHEKILKISIWII